MLILLEFYIRMLVLLEFAECNGFSLCEIWSMWFHAMILMKMKRIAMRVGKTLIDFEGETLLYFKGKGTRRMLVRKLRKNDKLK